MRVFLLIALLFSASLAVADERAVLQLVDYVGVDYPEAVAEGAVINAGEYAEMQDFAARIQDQVGAMAAGERRQALVALASQLAGQINGMAAPAQIASTTRQLREQLMQGLDISLVPRRAPDLEKAARQYAQQCAMCHGATGHGDGPAATGMEPAPTNFHDVARARERSLFGLFNTITLGVDGTGMAAFDGLSDSERWGLAFYVGAMHAPVQATAPAAWEAAPLTLEQAVTRAPVELAAGEDDRRYAWARQQPAVLFPSGDEPLVLSMLLLEKSASAYAGGSPGQARELAIRAYLEGFELSEAALANVAPTLMRHIEERMINYRALLDGNTPAADVDAEAGQLVALLEQAQSALAEDTLSPGVAYTSSLVILLREGLEAILVVAAMAAFLTKTNRHAGLKWLHGGWILALLAGGATWMVSSYVIEISGAARELTEGITALVAAVILFYVGFWMHSRANAQRWGQYIKEKMNAALSDAALWTLAVVSFLAVYREVFETVLFYQALWAQVGPEAQGSVVSGAVTALAALVLVAFIILRFGMRLPLGQFFTVTAYLMIGLAVVFVGKGVAALQEAGQLPFTPVAFPRLDLLGIYPNAQGLALQVLVLSLAVVLWWRQNRQQGASEAGESRPG
ncbi:MAG: cytochrome c/FTR1 family iron permease [Alcanivoracaceae bacterium]|jgi:high-affinity iron transporter|nr:cytochrome c/FTR1 family iron permease [Alcanivoracaceae bacterium]